MTIHVVNKGKAGEREICAILNAIVKELRQSWGLPPLAKEDELFQRNQNQSAVGGDDISNSLSLSIEVKRQETLSIDKWWEQTLFSAGRSKGIPILFFRQNRKKWRCSMFVDVPYRNPFNELSTNKSLLAVRGEITMEEFSRWFRSYYLSYLEEEARSI